MEVNGTDPDLGLLLLRRVTHTIIYQQVIDLEKDYVIRPGTFTPESIIPLTSEIEPTPPACHAVSLLLPIRL